MDVMTQFDVIEPAFEMLVEELSAEDVGRPSPCEGWAVRDVLDHMIGGATQFAAALRGEKPAPVADVPDAEKPATAIAAVADVVDAFRGPGVMEKIVATPFGDMPGETFARLVVFDLLMHTWDVATAMDLSLSIPDEVVGEVDAFARAVVTPELRKPGLFGAEVAPDADASALERLVAFSGRCR